MWGGRIKRGRKRALLILIGCVMFLLHLADLPHSAMTTLLYGGLVSADPPRLVKNPTLHSRAELVLPFWQARGNAAPFASRKSLGAHIFVIRLFCSAVFAAVMTLGCRPLVSHALPAKWRSWLVSRQGLRSVCQPPRLVYTLKRRCFSNSLAPGRQPRLLVKVITPASARPAQPDSRETHQRHDAFVAAWE